jgi:hypothetical protein
MPSLQRQCLLTENESSGTLCDGVCGSIVAVFRLKYVLCAVR